jgi:hypothetical protein
MGQAMSALTGVRAPAGGENAIRDSSAASSSTSAGPSQHGEQAHDGQLGARSGGGFGSAVIPPRASLNDLPVEVFDQMTPRLNPRDVEALAGTSRGIRKAVLSERSPGRYLQELTKEISSVKNKNDLRRVLGWNLGVAPLFSIESAPAVWKADLVGLLEKPLVNMSPRDFSGAIECIFKYCIEDFSRLCTANMLGRAVCSRFAANPLLDIQAAMRDVVIPHLLRTLLPLIQAVSADLQASVQASHPPSNVVARRVLMVGLVGAIGFYEQNLTHPLTEAQTIASFSVRASVSLAALVMQIQPHN